MQNPIEQSPSVASQHWEGDGTLHSYCYDYMLKRGWTATASAFAVDAGIDEEEWKGPPIEAPQGLLYEWWSVFWDVFIARSQKTGQRNLRADTYVEAMASKGNVTSVSFAGVPGLPPLQLPRSLAQPNRPQNGGQPTQQPGGLTPRIPYTSHVLQQQQLQEQLQSRGMPPKASVGRRPSPPGQQHASYQFQPSPDSHQGPPGGQFLAGSRPGSAHSSPHLGNAPHPYGNGAGIANARPPGPPTPSGGPQRIDGTHPFVQALAAIGLQGRDPATLTSDEEAAMQAQLRRMGLMPSNLTPGPGNPQFRGQPPQRQPAQRMQHPDQQFLSPQMRMAQPYPQGGPQHQMMLQQQQQQMHQMQERQMRQQLENEQNQVRLSQGGRSSDASLQQMQQGYTSSQVGSPSPAYSTAGPSPFTAPPQMGSSTPQAIQQNGFPSAPLPVTTRPAPKSRTASVSGQGKAPQPAGKRSGTAGSEESSPRSRKKPKANGGKEDERLGGGRSGSTSGPSSPVMPLGGLALPVSGPPAGQVGHMPFSANSPFRPSPSPSAGATLSNGRPEDSLGQALSPHPPGGGQEGVANGGIDTRHSPNLPSHKGVNGSDSYGSTNNPPLHISLPSPLPPTTFQLDDSVDSLTPGGSRPFAGAHPQMSAPSQGVGLGSNGSGSGEPGFGFNARAGEDMFGDFSGLEFAFDTFIDGELFKDDQSQT